MSEKRAIIGHGRHRAQGPHRMLPVGFLPMRLCIEGQALQIDVVSPVTTVGRHSDTDLRLGYPDVSRRHCQFVFEHGQWRVFDLHSLNGVVVNNRPVTDATLFAGDQVRIGSVTFLVLSATPAYEEKQHEKLRQIADVLPLDQTQTLEH